MSNYKQSPMRPSERPEAIASMYKQGKTLQEIATHFLVSRERIRQILNKAGVNSSEGGVHKRSQSRKQTKQMYRDLLYLETHGMTYQEYRAMVKFCRDEVLAGKSPYTTPLRAFITHRNNSNKRGIPFNLKFADWWKVWQDSGKWDQRAVNGYVMARLMDNGPYEIGNIYITTSSKNVKHYQERRQNKSFDDWSDCYFPTLEAA